ncbi:MAG: hypothetical protein WBA41_23035 [Rivularia sp. (in: cyanobacteria)]
MNLFSSRVKARLYKKGYQGFTKDDYAEAAFAIGLVDENNPTKEELEKAVSHLIDKQTYQLTETDEEVNLMLRQQENTTEEKQIQDETKGEITFANRFEKAGAIQKAFEDNGIVASDVEAVTISGRLADTFTSHNSFILEALQEWREYRLSEESKESDKVRRLLADIRTDSVVASNKINESINATATFINDVRAKQREEFMNFLSQVRNG